MKRLEEYSVLTEQTFYRGWHILDYIRENPNMSALEWEAVKASMMVALVDTNSIDYEKEALDLEHFCITDKCEGLYCYLKYPNVCGIPLWMKRKFREKSLKISSGSPVSMFLTMPSGVQRCVYDMNTASSVFFDDWTFYEVNYKSPTKPGKVATERPFIEITIDGIPYLLDHLTRRIYRRDYFEKTYGFDIVYSASKSEIYACQKKRDFYEEQTSDNLRMDAALETYFTIGQFIQSPNACEYHYEVEMSKKYFPEGWQDYQEFKEAMENDDEGKLTTFFQKLKNRQQSK